jgi:hypothetical protein
MHKCNYTVTRNYFANGTVSIFILTEGDAGGLFFNMVFTVLFIWLYMWFYIFYILITLFNNELVGRGDYRLVIGPLDLDWT